MTSRLPEATATMSNGRPDGRRYHGPLRRHRARRPVLRPATKPPSTKRVVAVMKLDRGLQTFHVARHVLAEARRHRCRRRAGGDAVDPKTPGSELDAAPRGVGDDR